MRGAGLLYGFPAGQSAAKAVHADLLENRHRFRAVVDNLTYDRISCDLHFIFLSDSQKQGAFQRPVSIFQFQACSLILAKHSLQ